MPARAGGRGSALPLGGTSTHKKAYYKLVGFLGTCHSIRPVLLWYYDPYIQELRNRRHL
jgi:hypothetical protein